MIFRMMRYGLMALIVVNLAACATLFGKNNFIAKNETQYLRSNTTPPLQLPPGASAANIGNDYPIPPAMGPTQTVSLLPPGSLAEKIATGQVPASVLKEKPAPAAPTAVTETAQNNSALPAAMVLVPGQSTAQIWNNIGSALKRAGYMVVNQNQKTSIYYLLDTPSTGGKVKMSTPIYQLHLHDVDGSAQATVTDNDGKLLAPVISQRILLDLQNALTGKTSSPVTQWLREVF